MVIKQKIDSVTNNMFFRIRRIGFIKTIFNSVSSIFQTRGLKFAYITLMILFTTGIVNALVEGSRYAGSGQPIIPNFIFESNLPSKMVYNLSNYIFY